MVCMSSIKYEKSPCFNFSIVLIYLLLILSLLFSIFSICMSIYVSIKESSTDDEIIIDNIVVEN